MGIMGKWLPHEKIVTPCHSWVYHYNMSRLAVTAEERRMSQKWLDERDADDKRTKV